MLEDLLVRTLAKKKGIPQEEAKLLLEALKQQDDYEEIKKSLSAVADIGRVVNTFPPTIQPLAAPLVTQHMYSSGSRAEKIAENVALVAAAIKGAYGSDNDSMAQIIEDLRNEIRELKGEKTKQEQEAMMQQFSKTLESVTDYISSLEKKIDKLERNNDGSGDDLDVILEYAEKVKQAKESLEQLGMIENKDKFDISKAEETLKHAGYKIERPMTWESLQQYIESQMKKIREEAKKEAMEDLKMEEKRLSLITDFITTIGGAAIEALSGNEPAGHRSTDLKERFSEWQQKVSGQEIQVE